jgi:RNase P subunit RPR2
MTPLNIRLTGINQRPLTTIEKFASRFEIQPNGCWEWVGFRNHAGYGMFSVNKVSRSAHRVMWEAVGRPVDLTLQLDHLCRNRACINPKHLEQVDGRTNTMRGDTVTAKNAQKTTCDQGHPFLGDNLYLRKRTRAGGYIERNCRTCAENYRIKNRAKSALQTNQPKEGEF